MNFKGNSIILSIIVSNKNRLKILQECLQRIEKYTVVPYNLYIIDIDSSDGSKEYLKKYWFEKAELIFEKYPYPTYAESNNKVMKRCNTPYIYLLNNDCWVEENWEIACIEMFKKYPEVGHVASLVLWENRLVQSHGANIMENGNTICQYQRKKENDPVMKKIRNYAYAGLGMYRKELLEKLDYLPEYPSKIYWSDTGWGMKVWEAGFDVRYCPNSKVIHLLHKSERQGHYSDVNEGRKEFMKEWGEFLKENKGFFPDYPFTGKRPYRKEKLY